MSAPGSRADLRAYIERLLIAVALVALALLLWRLRGLLMLVFGAVLVAVIFSLVATPIRRWLRLPAGVALVAAVLVVAGVIGLALWMFGAEVARQAGALQEMIPGAWRSLQARLEPLGLAEPLREWVNGLGSGSGILSNLGGLAMSIGNGVADTVLVLVGGVYLAAQPDLYRRGLVKLVPERGRGLAGRALDDSGEALKRWLLGRLAAMAVVGLLTGFGLWLIGVPSALTLGLLAALLDFVPFIGPIVAAVPGVLLALAQGPETALWTAGLYLLVQQVEGNVIDPMVQQRAVSLPPALLIFSLVAGGLLFGIIGILFAAPLTVVLFVLVKRLYVREALGTETRLPTEKN